MGAFGTPPAGWITFGMLDGMPVAVVDTEVGDGWIMIAVATLCVVAVSVPVGTMENGGAVVEGLLDVETLLAVDVATGTVVPLAVESLGGPEVAGGETELDGIEDDGALDDAGEVELVGEADADDDEGGSTEEDGGTTDEEGGPELDEIGGGTTVTDVGDVRGKLTL